MRTFEIGSGTAAITQMRLAGEGGTISHELLQGNMLPRLCAALGDRACVRECLRDKVGITAESKLCAELNILGALTDLGVSPENFAIAAATKFDNKDRVGFGDGLEDLGANRSKEGYLMAPSCQAFFFRPGKDKAPDQHALTNVGMRMADCGAVVYEFSDKQGDRVLGIAHFGRETMQGPSAYTHEIDGRKVSWAEYIQHQVVSHYGADPAKIKVKLIAAVEGKDFIHTFTNVGKMEEKFPGWDKLGFMIYPKDRTEDFECLIKYREMILWQLRDSIQDPTLRLSPENIDFSEVINTGDLTLGHASHRAAQEGRIPHGRDLYIVGRKPEVAASNTNLTGN